MKSQIIENLPALKQQLKDAGIKVVEIKKELTGVMGGSTVERALNGLQVECQNAKLFTRTCNRLIVKANKQAA